MSVVPPGVTLAKSGNERHCRTSNDEGPKNWGSGSPGSPNGVPPRHDPQFLIRLYHRVQRFGSSVEEFKIGPALGLPPALGELTCRENFLLQLPIDDGFEDAHRRVNWKN